jgi:hypothetical protein
MELACKEYEPELPLSKLWCGLLKIPKPEELGAYIDKIVATINAAYDEVKELEAQGMPFEEALSLVMERYTALEEIEQSRSAILGIYGYR